MGMSLPRRAGPRPAHDAEQSAYQLDQQPEDPALIGRAGPPCASLPDVDERPSAISVPGARALWLRPGVPAPVPPGAFLIGREFAPPPSRPGFQPASRLPRMGQ